MATKEIGATGRRKTAIARVRLTPGTGKLSVNERGLDDYFPRPTARMIIAQPFQLAKAEAAYDAIIKVTGGGVSAQASAIRHAISRALCRSGSAGAGPACAIRAQGQQNAAPQGP
jgi:small subunit ribosomal protein S9